MKKYILFFLFCLLIYSNKIIAGMNVVGSITSANSTSDLKMGPSGATLPAGSYQTNINQVNVGAGTSADPTDPLANFVSRESGVKNISGTSTNSLDVNNGVSVDAGESGNMDMNTPLNSPIILGENATLVLSQDLRLSSDSYFVLHEVGNFSGRGLALDLANTLSFQQCCSLRFTTSTIINGNGHGLDLPANFKLEIDPGITVTFKNLIVNGLGNSGSFGQILLHGANSSLALENVILNLDDDYSFTQGSLFINDDVAICGTTEFGYASQSGCFIMDHSTLEIDHGITFTYMPGNSRHPNGRNLMIMESANSNLVLNGCTFNAPVDGIELTKGRVFFDNKVILKNYDGAGVKNTDSSKAITFGDGVSAINDVTTKVLSGARVILEGSIDINDAP